MFRFFKTIESMEKRLERIERLLSKEGHIMTALESLIAQVAANTSVEASAAAAIHGIADQLAAALANNDTAELQSLTTQLKTSADALSAAIPANTAPAATPDAPPATS